MVESQKALSVRRSFGGMRILGDFRVFGCFGRVFGFLFCSIFFLAGALIIWSAAIGPIVKILGAQSWVATDCQIISSEVEGDETYRIAIEYEYDYLGNTYTGDQYSFFNLQTSGRAGKEKIVAQYPPDSEQTCYVNPGRPNQSVISRGLSGQMWWGLLGVPFLAVGLIGCGVLYYSGKSQVVTPVDALSAGLKNENDVLFDDDRELAPESPHLPFEPMTAVRQATTTEWSDSEFDEDDLFEEPGPIKLEPDSHPMAAFGCLLIFGLIWNGILSVFVFQRLGDWVQFKFKGFEDLFLVPFLLVGIGVIIGAIYSLMAAFNPRPTMTLSRQLIPLGGSARLQWVFDAGIGSLRRLSVTIVGTEEATYRRGTSTYTDTNKFHSEQIFETDDPQMITGGEVEILIPTDTMHTFQASDNKITWKIQLHGDVPFWPDIHAAFPIRVVPHE